MIVIAIHFWQINLWWKCCDNTATSAFPLRPWVFSESTWCYGSTVHLLLMYKGGLQPIYIRDIPYNFIGTSSQCPMPGASIQGFFEHQCLVHPRKLTCPLKRTVLIGNTSSNHSFSRDMLVFRGVCRVFQEARPLTVGSLLSKKVNVSCSPHFSPSFPSGFFFATRPVEAPVLSVSPFPRKLNYGAVELPLLQVRYGGNP